MAKPRVKLNLRGINKVLRAAQPEIDRVGKRMAGEAGEGFEYEAKPYKWWTARGFVQTKNDTDVGRARQAREHVLQKLLGKQG